MEKVVVDSDIIIDFLRTGKGALPSLLDLQKKATVELYLSSITIMELFAGKSAKKEEQSIADFVSDIAVIPFDRKLAERAGAIKRDRKLDITLADYIIGITAISIDGKLATRNRNHFKAIPKLEFFEI